MGSPSDCPVCGEGGGFHDSEQHHFPREKWGSPQSTSQEDDYRVEQWFSSRSSTGERQLLTTLKTKIKEKDGNTTQA